MNKVCSFFMVIGLAAALHVNAQGGGFFHPGEDSGLNNFPTDQFEKNGPNLGRYMMVPHEGSDRMGAHGNGNGMMPPPPHRGNEERSIVENQFCINSGTIQFKDVQFTLPNNELMRVKRDKSKNKKGNGHLQLSGSDGFCYEGNVYVDKKCEAAVTVDHGVIWTGYANRNKRSKQVTITVNGTWNLTDDSYISRLVIGKDAMVNTNGHKLKYKSLENLGELN